MTIQIYLLGVCISAALWFLGIKLRQSGWYIQMPRKSDGNLLDPLNHKNVNYRPLMLGWVLMSVLWPLGWGLLILCYVVAWIIEIVCWIWNNTIGNEKLARKIFGGKE